MSDAEKRALLSSWASDRHAVENAPALRRLDSGAVVPVDDILAALAALPADPSSSIRAPAGPPWSGASGLSFPQAEGAVEDEGWLVPE